jgi:hypothetical protein
VLQLVGRRLADDLLCAKAVDHDQQAPGRDVDVGDGELTRVLPFSNDAADERQPVVGQHRSLGSQRGVASTQAPGVQPQGACLVADVVEQVVHQRADLGGRRRDVVDPRARAIQVGITSVAKRRGDQLFRRREVVADQSRCDA